MGHEENPKKDVPAVNPTSSQGNKTIDVDVELTDEDLDKVSGGLSHFPVQPGTPHIPNP